MSYFVSFLIVSTISSLIYNRFISSNIYLKKFIFVIMILYLIFLGAFRDVSIGTDNMSYFSYYSRELTWDEIGEYYHYSGLIFWYGMMLIKKIFDSYQVVDIITSLVSVGLLSRFIWRRSPNPFLSLFVFVSFGFYLIGYSMVRQYLAIAIFITAIDYYIANNKKRFYFTVLVAIFTHVSSAVLLPIFFLMKKRITNKIIAFYVFMTSIVYLVTDYVVNIISNMLFNGYYQNFMTDNGGGRLTFLLYIIVSIYVMLFKYKINNKEMTVYSNIIMFATVIQSTTFSFEMASRAAYYCGMILIVFLPILVYRMNFAGKIMMELMIYTVGWSVYLLKFYNLNNIYPYKFFWE